MSADHPVVIIGAGISGISCARALHDGGVPVVVRDRGMRMGGRMAVRTIAGRPVDIGASYFTVRSPEFSAVVEDWEARGLARRWTSSFHVATPEGLQHTTTGPLRWAAADGLRSLVEDLAAGLSVSVGVDAEDVDPGPTVDGEPAAAVVLAMPGPQAGDLLSAKLTEEIAIVSAGEWDPVLSLHGRWPERSWPDIDGAFVNDSPLLTWVADDGRRRGDGAPVLVAHSTPVLAAAHLDDPESAGPPMLAELSGVLGLTAAPEEYAVKRWGLARPHRAREATHHLGEAMVGLCGDGWAAPSRIEAAYLSGRALGEDLLARLRAG